MLPQNTWMTNEETLRLIEQTRVRLDAGEDKVRLAVSLRKSLDSERGAFVLSQAELQIRGRKKFTRADQMLFTPVGLEQSTSEVIADFKSAIVPSQLERFDICCGIGGDSIGLGRQQKITSVDRDETTCILAQHNLSVYDAVAPNVIAQDFESMKAPDDAFLHIDPDRRTQGRTVRPENFSPNLDQILEKLLLNQDSPNRMLCIKLAPSTQLTAEFSLPTRLQWIGHQRECKQQLLWLGQNVDFEQRLVTIIDSKGEASDFLADEESFEQVVAPSIGDAIHEPHSAILSADLVDEFALKHGLARLCYGSVYLTGPANSYLPFAASFRLLDSCSIKEKAIKERLATYDIGQVEWKNRGVDQKTVSRISRIHCDGSQKGVVILTRLGNKFICFICQRV